MVHPLAGQGLNMAFGDIQTLSDVIFGAVSSGQDFGLTLHWNIDWSTRHVECAEKLSSDACNSKFDDDGWNRLAASFILQSSAAYSV